MEVHGTLLNISDGLTCMGLGGSGEGWGGGGVEVKEEPDAFYCRWAAAINVISPLADCLNVVAISLNVAAIHLGRQ